MPYVVGGYVGETPEPEIPAKRYVQRVINDTYSLSDSIKAETGKHYLEFWDILEIIHAPTRDRMIDMGVHPQAGLPAKMVRALDHFIFTIDEVPLSWEQEWVAATEKITRDHNLTRVAPSDVWLRPFKRAAKDTTEDLVLLGVAFFFLNDAYQSGKRAVTRRIG